MNLTRWLPAALAGIVFSATVVSGQTRDGCACCPAVASRRRTPVSSRRAASPATTTRRRRPGCRCRALSLTDVPAHGEVWEKVLRKVRSGEMPPPTVRTRPDPRRRRHLRPSSRTHARRRSRRAKPNPGRAPVHRLNRAEYSNAIRDLLAVDVKPGAWLPVDDSGYGFDNIAAVLSTSPALLERYMTAARRISRLAVGDIYAEAGRRDLRRQARSVQGHAQRADQRRSALRLARRHFDTALFSGGWRVRLQGSHSRSADRRERSGDRPVPGAHPGEGGTSLGRRHVAARKSEGRERRARTRGGGAGGRGGVPQVPYPVDLRLDGARVKRFDVPGGTPDVRQLVIGGPTALRPRA